MTPKRFIDARRIKAKINTYGFTIVELLIVIVVIGILATLTAVVFSGIQSKAYAARVTVAVDAYTKLLDMYKVDVGHYPPDINNPVCLGEASYYPASDGLASGYCEAWDESWDGVPLDIAVSSSFNDLLTPYSNKLPDASLPIVIDDVAGVRSRGAVYGFWEYQQADNDIILRPAISYYPKGDQNCPRGEKYGYYDDVDVTYCYVWLGDPENPEYDYGTP